VHPFILRTEQPQITLAVLTSSGVTSLPGILAVTISLKSNVVGNIIFSNRSFAWTAPGASQCGTESNDANPTVGLSCGPYLHTTSEDDQMRPQHTTQTHNKHHHHGGVAANSSSNVDLTNPCHPRGGRPCVYIFQGHCKLLYLYQPL